MKVESRERCIKKPNSSLPWGKEVVCALRNLSELGHEGNHQIEQTDGLDEGETQNGVREQLATEGGVAGNTLDQGSENQTDTDTGTSQTDGSRAHTNVLGDLNHGLGDLGRVGAAAESSLLGNDAGLGALDSLEGAGAGSSCGC